MISFIKRKTLLFRLFVFILALSLVMPYLIALTVYASDGANLGAEVMEEPSIDELEKEYELYQKKQKKQENMKS